MIRDGEILAKPEGRRPPVPKNPIAPLWASLGQTYSLVQEAFNQFSHDGHNDSRLRVDLANAVNRIPWNRRDGLLATVLGVITNLRTALAPGADKPVLS